MKQTIEIECPNGYKPVYNPDTKKVEIIPDNVMDRVKTYEDARRCLGYVKLGDVTYNGSINALAKLQTILEALNKGHKFKLLTGNVWYPWVRFYRVDSIPEGSKIVRYFSYQGEKFAPRWRLRYYWYCFRSRFLRFSQWGQLCHCLCRHVCL